MKEKFTSDETQIKITRATYKLPDEQFKVVINSPTLGVSGWGTHRSLEIAETLAKDAFDQEIQHLSHVCFGILNMSGKMEKSTDSNHAH